MPDPDGTHTDSVSEQSRDIPDTKSKFQGLRRNGILTDLAELEPLSLNSGTLCNLCDRIIKSSWPICWPKRKCSEVQRSAAQCQLCSMLNEMINNADNPHRRKVEAEEAWLQNFSGTHHDPNGCFTQPFTVTNSNTFPPAFDIGELLFVPTEYQPVTNVDTIPATVTEQTWELIQTWMDVCNTNHPYCIKSETQDQNNPSRLLEIDPLGSPSKIKLIEGVEIPPKARYMTLSHCWGAVRPLVLSKDTWEQFKDSIAISALPKTFQDAVTITKRLHVKYLWIDSLCIIQDSDEDWAKESNRMASVYGGSYCNIAASGASDCNRGCLGPRPQIGQYRAVRIVTKFHQASEPVQIPNISGAKHKRHSDFVCAQVGLEWEELHECPLSSRAWVFQERALSPRTLHFGLSQLFWECNHHLACERYPESLAALDSLRLRSYKLLKNRLRQLHSDPELRSSELSEAWADFVDDYSNARLTYDTDRLVAMAGIIDVFAAGLEDDFLGGLWRKELFSQLLLKRADNNIYGRRPKEYIAPSWSWVSLFDTPILSSRFPDEETFLLQILHAQVEVNANRPKYSLCGGDISVRCCMIRALVHEEREIPTLERSPGTPRYSVDGRLIHTSTMTLYSSTNQSIELPNGRAVLTFDTEDWHQHKPLWFVPIVQYETRILGLILYPAGIGSEFHFLRCGMFDMHAYAHDPWASIFSDATQEFTAADESAESPKIDHDNTSGSIVGESSTLATASYISVITIK